MLNNNTLSMKHIKTLLITLSMGAIAAGCAHTPAPSQDLDQKLSSEPEITNYSQLREETKTFIEQHPSLTAEQKSQLVDLKVETSKKLDDLEKEILKLKGALIKNILADKYKAKEVIQIEKKIETLSKRKLVTFFDALEKGNKILGKTSAKTQIIEELHLERNSSIFRDIRLNRI